MHIYETIYNIDGRNYVGLSTHNVEKSKNYYGSGKLIKAAIKKHGIENFTKRIIEILPEGSSRKQLGEREQFWIENKNSRYPNGFNLTRGGDGGACWNKGLTKETDVRVAKYSSSPRWNSGLRKETDERVKKSAEKLIGKQNWKSGLTKETDERVKRAGQSLSISKKGVQPKSFCRKGKIPWNKGLTKETDERVKRNIEKLQAGFLNYIKNRKTKETK